ncbi:MAG: hypothetical protein LBS91_07695 [Clostridiales Family XIII bacterium]|jgi:hypothetical protein|nr:hypothetical protein [Clostridiales Family XIII bacterium]
MAKKVSDEQCRANYEGVVALFRAAVPDSDRFEVVYGAGVGVGLTNAVIVLVTTYTYTSYAIGFDVNANEIMILPIAQDLSGAGQPISLKKSEIDKAKISMISKELTIIAKFLPKKYVRFSVQWFINDDPDETVVCVLQTEEAKRFHEFFKQAYSK